MEESKDKKNKQFDIGLKIKKISFERPHVEASTNKVPLKVSGALGSKSDKVLSLPDQISELQLRVQNNNQVRST